MTDTSDAEAGPEPTERPDRVVTVGTGDELDDLVTAHDVVLVMFRTKGCTLCQSMEPVLDNVVRATDAVVATCNPQTDVSLVEEFAIRSVPTLVLFVDGEPVDRLADGFVPTTAVVEFVGRNVETAA